MVEAAAMMTAEAREMMAAMAAANAAAMASRQWQQLAIAALREFLLLMRWRGYNHVDDGVESGSKVRVAVITAANAIATQR